MMSRTIRYFKLIYIVAGILLSNEEICDTVDQIQIATRVEVKEKNHQQPTKKIQRLAIEDKNKTTLNKCWFRKFDLFQMAKRIKSRVRPRWCAFTIWTIPNYLIEYSTNVLSRKFVISSDCDVIYK